MPINLNQCRGTAGMFNNCKNIYCYSCNIYYNKALRIYSSFILFRVIFICVAYLFSLAVCSMSSSSILLRAKFQISYTYLNTILYSSITYMSIPFGFIIFLWNFVVMLKKTPDLNLAQNKSSPFTIGIWIVFLRIIILNSLF